MKPKDLKDAFPPAPKAFHEALERAASRLEEKPFVRRAPALRRSLAVGVALALVGTVAAAAAIGLGDFARKGWHLLEGPAISEQDVTDHMLKVEQQSCTLKAVRAQVTEAMWLGGQLHFAIRVEAADPAKDALLYGQELGTDGEHSDWVFPGGSEADAKPIDEWLPEGKRALLCHDGYRISAVDPAGEQTPLYTWESDWLSQGDSFVMRISTGFTDSESYDWQALVHEDGLLHLEFDLYTDYWQGESEQGMISFSLRPPTEAEMLPGAPQV